MTAYVATCVGSSDSNFGIQANTYALRISNIVMHTDTGNFWMPITRAASTLTGGTQTKIMAMHDGAPAASAWAGHGVTYSNPFIIWEPFIASASTNWEVHTDSPFTTDSPLPLTVLPGHSFIVDTPGAANQSTTIFFEEIRLSGSF